MRRFLVEAVLDAVIVFVILRPVLDHPRPSAVPVRDRAGADLPGSAGSACSASCGSGIAIGLVNRFVRPLDRGPDRSLGALDDGHRPDRDQRHHAVDRDADHPGARRRRPAAADLVPGRGRPVHGAVRSDRRGVRPQRARCHRRGQRSLHLAHPRRAAHAAAEPDPREHPAPAGLRHDLSLRPGHRPREDAGRVRSGSGSSARCSAAR